MSNQYLDGTYLQSNPTWHVEDSAWKARQIGTMLARNNLSPSSIGEVGCGAGEILAELSRTMDSGVVYHGWEISEQAFGLCRQREAPRLSFYNSDPLTDGRLRCDVMMAIDVIEHVEDYLGFLRKLRETATYKLFHIPLDLSVYGLLREYPMAMRDSVGHLHYFTKSTALATLQTAGYRVLDHMYTPVALEASTKGFMKTMLRYPRKMGSAINADFTVKVLGGYSLMVLAQ